jgi:two-component system chemotaxis response regulator CheY
MISAGGNMLKKVLVVDDSALIHQMYKMVLMRYRCQIVNALNGQEGLDKLEKNPDVSMMLVDINMPLMNGLEFIQKVKALGKYDNIPIVIVSTEGKEEDTQRGIALGAIGYVKKPFQPSDLHNLITKIFGAA